jgi:tellurite methyltransferase
MVKALRGDRTKWDRIYDANRYDPCKRDRFRADQLLAENGSLLSGGLALDFACGYGGNALFAAARGYTVHAVDISFTALAVLQKEAIPRDLDVQCVLADLDRFPLPMGHYDLVLIFTFFAPQLMPAVAASLKPGGLLFSSTFNHRHTSVKPGFNPKYLVPRGGLAKFFPEFAILLDEPDAGDRANLSRVIARKAEGK